MQVLLKIGVGGGGEVDIEHHREGDSLHLRAGLMCIHPSHPHYLAPSWACLGFLRQMLIEGLNPSHNLDSLQLSPGSLPFSPSFPHMAFPRPSNVLVNLTLALKHYTQQNKGLVINQTYPPRKGFSKVSTKNEGRLDRGIRAVLLKTTTW